MPTARNAFAAGLVALGIPFAAHAAITPQAKLIVDRYVEASGGAAALAKQVAMHAKGRINTMKFKGSFEQWTQTPDRLVSRMSLGPLRFREGYDGHTGWRTDLNSKEVTILDGHDLERLRGEAYFENEMWAREDQGGGKVAQGTSAFRDGQDYRSIEVTPPEGSGRRLWFSVKTGLMTRVVTHGDNADHDEWLSEYRTIAGRKRATLTTPQEEAHRITFDPHEEPDSERMLLDSVWVAASFDSSRFAAPASENSPLTWLKTRGVARVPFRYGTRHVWIRASINGAPPADFLLDTGCSSTAIDLDYAEQIGLAKQGRFMVQGMGGNSEASFARVASIRVGGGDGDGVTVRDFKVGIIDLGEGHEWVMWRKMAGLIGYDFLSRFVVEIDYDRQIVTFRDPKSFVYSGKGRALDIRLMSGVPIVRAAVGGGCAGDFLVDVGNYGFDLHGSLVRRCQMVQAVEARKQLRVYSGGVGDMFVSWMCRLDSLSLGPFGLRDPIAGMSLSKRGMVGSQEYAGNIGNSVLERFIVTFDYDRRKLYLEPGAKYAQRDRYSRSGTLFLRLKHKVVPAGIVHGSPADEAGLKPDDEIVSINSRSALTFSPEELDRVFVNGALGTTQILTVRRDDKLVKLELTLQDVL
jgi:hypothetical protein